MKPPCKATRKPVEAVVEIVRAGRYRKKAGMVVLWCSEMDLLLLLVEVEFVSSTFSKMVLTVFIAT